MQNYRPPKQLKDPRGAQSISSIKGKAYNCIIEVVGGGRFLVNQLRVVPSSDGIRLLISDPVHDMVLPPNSRVNIDLAKELRVYQVIKTKNEEP